MLRAIYESEEVIPLLTSEKKPPTRRPSEVATKLIISYPKGVIFVLVSKFLEALDANGIRTILALYLRDDLHISESLATIILHIFNFFGQFCPIFGAILADSYCGNIKSISYFYVIYALGWIGLIITSLPISMPVIFFVTLSLLLVGTGNGSIRACITSLGATQFKLPEQQKYLDSYFSHYYFAYYLGIFMSKTLPPSIRSETSCFGKPYCYPAVFGVLGAIFVGSWMTFLIGKFFYKHEYPAQENILLRVCGCMKHAICSKFSTSQLSARSHWLDHSIEVYGADLVQDVKRLLKISALFLPLPIYFALLAQQDSTWTFQAALMDTTILGFQIEPDQAKAMGPIFLFTLIPLWQYLIYPFLNRCGIFIHPLHSVAIGGLCSGLAFVASGILQLLIEANMKKTFNIMWQAPQFLLLMLGELFVSIPGLQFAFTQAPASMKSVLTAIWFINFALGNLVVVILTELHLMDIQSSEYFLYSILMFLSMIVFTLLALQYIRSNIHSVSNSNNDCNNA